VKHPLKIKLAWEPAADPVIAFLQANHYDVGSVSTARIAEGAPPDARSICVGLPDAEAIDELAMKMAREITDPAARELCKRVAFWPGPLETWVVAFLDIAAIEVP
jgi:hypothetical protein